MWKTTFFIKTICISASKDNYCDVCGYVAKNIRALTAHHRGSKKQRDIERTEQITNSLVNGNTNNEMQYNPNSV